MASNNHVIMFLFKANIISPIGNAIMDIFSTAEQEDQRMQLAQLYGWS
jgi:hypothetical protein